MYLGGPTGVVQQQQQQHRMAGTYVTQAVRNNQRPPNVSIGPDGINIGGRGGAEWRQLLMSQQQSAVFGTQMRPAFTQGGHQGKLPVANCTAHSTRCPHSPQHIQPPQHTHPTAHTAHSTHCPHTPQHTHPTAHTPHSTNSPHPTAHAAHSPHTPQHIQPTHPTAHTPHSPYTPQHTQPTAHTTHLSEHHPALHDITACYHPVAPSPLRRRPFVHRR
jgi:hypothetical protein